MKTKLKSLLGILFMTALFFSCSHSSGNKNQGGDDPKLLKTKWLVLLYMDGDNNLNDVLYVYETAPPPASLSGPGYRPARYTNRLSRQDSCRNPPYMAGCQSEHNVW